MKSPAILRLILLTAAMASSCGIMAQISGIIMSPNAKPVGGAEVFINKTIIRATTDEFGQFALTGIPPGFHEIVAYKKGLALYRAPMRIQEERSYNLNLQLQEAEKKPKGKPGENDKATFARDLIGEEGLIAFQNEKQVEVLMQEGKYFVESGPVVLDYPNAGYRITCYFPVSSFAEIAATAYCYQEYVLTDVNQNIAFEKSRMSLYLGSLRHWLMALVVGKTGEEGFTMQDETGKSVSDQELVTNSSVAGYSRVRIEKPLTVRYKNDQVSTLRATGMIDVSKMGTMINPRLLTTEGAMKKTGLAHQLPMDYRPIAGDVESSYAEALKNFYEKIYVQTDKPYYYPGEPLWFKAYINYYGINWRDSLSDVLHIELLNPSHKVMSERMYRIERGMTHGDFILPDSLPKGTYYLRASTNLQRNFGDSHLFTKPLPVIGMLEKADHVQRQTPAPSQQLAITPNKQTYRVRDPITLEFSLKDAQGAPLASNLSVAVTDAVQVAAIPEVNSILRDYPINPQEIAKINDIKYRVERGISFYGQFLNNKGKGEKTQLSFIQWKTGDILSAETDEDGMFWQTGLQFTDSARFSYKSDKAKGKPYGKVIILPREAPAFHAPKEPDLKVVEAGTVQRIFSEYEVPKENILLDEVAVSAARINNDDAERAKRRSYGRADHVVSAKNLNIATSNLLLSLVGKVPGLVVNPTTPSIYFARASANSIVNPISPLVTINDVPMSGDAATVLLTIDPNIVESIEFTARLNVLYGSQGANGVIAVYTRSGVSVDTTDPNFQTVKLPGFSKTREFQAPDYANAKTDASAADYRATIYWNPKVSTDDKSGAASVSFFAADLPGFYRVVVEGVTAGGKPIRGEAYITIEERP